MLSGGVKHALKFIAKIGAVPLDKAGLMDQFPDSPATIDIKSLEEYNLKINANFEEIFREYTRVHHPKEHIVELFNSRLAVEEAQPLGSAYKPLSRKFSLFSVNF